MRTGRPKAALMLTNDERERLDSLAHRSRSSPASARRARIILACAEGSDGKVVARRLHVTPATVSKWRGRFVRDRLDGLYDEPRPGAARKITDAMIEHVIVRTLETKPRGATHWTTRTMAKAVGLNRMAILAAPGAPSGCNRIAARRSSSPTTRCWSTKCEISSACI